MTENNSNNQSKSGIFANYVILGRCCSTMRLGMIMMTMRMTTTDGVFDGYGYDVAVLVGERERERYHEDYANGVPFAQHTIS